MVATLPSFVAQNVAAFRAGGGIDALTAVQVRKTARLHGRTRRSLLRRRPRGGARPRRLARVLGRLTLPEQQVVGVQEERWAFGFLFDVILTRDTWMHVWTSRAPPAAI